MSLTMAFSSCNNWLRSVLLPTLVFPTMAGDTFFECVTHLERTCECRHPIINLTGKSDKFRTVGELQFFMVAEVQFQFQ